MPIKHIAFRTDVSQQIGTGHFMRCLTLADGLNQQGMHIRFVSRHLPEYLQNMLEEKEYEFVILDSRQNDVPIDELAHANWLGVSQEQDATDSVQALSDLMWDWIMVDHYALDHRWESTLRQSSKKILVIDDIADRQHDCDVLLDQNFYTDMEMRYTDKVPSFCQLLLGPKYALLREEFSLLHKHVKPRNGSVKRVLVFFGGVDADNYTGRTIEILSEIRDSDLHVDVVIGLQHPCCEQIKAKCIQYEFNFYVQTDKMATLMASADLAIGAGGSATWERCCLGLPALSICIAENQSKQISDAAKEALMYAPQFGKDLMDEMKNHIIAFVENPYLREYISSRAMQFVDGRGVLRIIRELGCSGIVMRRVNPNDLLNLFDWRNHPNIRSVSKNGDSISWENHQKWFANVINSNDKVLLIGENNGDPIGVVRFDKQTEVADVSIYLVPDVNHSGQGRNLLSSAEQWIKENHSDIKYIRAIVLGNNNKSQQMFINSNYTIETTHYIKQL